jgi:hypothetical protein
MTTARLRTDLHALGVTLAADGDRLRFCPRDKVTPELLQRLRTHKAELLGMLQPGDIGDGDETHPSPGKTGVVSPAVPHVLQPGTADAPQPWPSDGTGYAGPVMPGDDSQDGGPSVTPSGDALPQDLQAQDINCDAARVTTTDPSNLQARPTATVDRTSSRPNDSPPWPPTVPGSILADRIPACSKCGRCAVVPGQPGRPAGLCFACWGKRR